MTQLQTTEPVGRLVIDLPRSLSAEQGATSDVALRGGDRLMIPKGLAGSDRLGRGAECHVALLPRGYWPKRVHITERRAHCAGGQGSYLRGQSRRQRPSEPVEQVVRRGDARIMPGDTVVVPLEADRIRPLTLWTSVTQILYNIAVAVAAVNSF